MTDDPLSGSEGLRLRVQAYLDNPSRLLRLVTEDALIRDLEADRQQKAVRNLEQQIQIRDADQTLVAFGFPAKGNDHATRVSDACFALKASEADRQRLRAALEQLTRDDCGPNGGRVIKGNEQLPGPVITTFYKGYNAGIMAQFKKVQDMALKALASPDSHPEGTSRQRLEAENVDLKVGGGSLPNTRIRQIDAPMIGGVSDGSSLPPATCLDCGLPYEQFPLDMLFPRAQWLRIHPGENGLLCAQCMVTRASWIPGATAVHAVIEITPVPEAQP